MGGAGRVALEDHAPGRAQQLVVVPRLDAREPRVLSADDAHDRRREVPRRMHAHRVGEAHQAGHVRIEERLARVVGNVPRHQHVHQPALLHERAQVGGVVPGRLRDCFRRRPRGSRRRSRRGWRRTGPRCRCSSRAGSRCGRGWRPGGRRPYRWRRARCGPLRRSGRARESAPGRGAPARSRQRP